MVDLLLKAGVSPNTGNEDDESIIALAVTSENMPEVESLINAGAVIKSGERCQSPTATAARLGNLPMVQRLARALQKDINGKAQLDRALRTAAAFGRLNVVKWLVTQTVDLNVGADSNELGRVTQADSANFKNPFTALSEAIENGQDQTAQFLLESGARPTGRSSDGGTVVSMAMDRDDLILAELLKKHGADWDAVDINSDTPLVKMIREHKKARIEWLLASGVAVSKPGLDGETPLLAACEYGNLDLLQNLLKRGAKLTEKDNYGDGPLIEAVCGNQVEIVEFLLAKGVPVDRQDQTATTALHYAAKNGNEEIVALLLRAEQSDPYWTQRNERLWIGQEPLGMRIARLFSGRRP